MISDIEFDVDFDPIQFDSDLPINLAEVTRDGVLRVKYDPGKFSCRSDQRSDFQVPINPFPGRCSLELPKNLPEEHILTSNKRIKLGKSPFSIPRGFKPGSVKTVSHDNVRETPLLKWLGNHPDLKQVEKVVEGIRELGVDEFRPSELTYPMRNALKAASIQRVLQFLIIHHGALKKVENIHVSKPGGGRPPGECFRILWGESVFFPQKNN